MTRGLAGVVVGGVLVEDDLYAVLLLEAAGLLIILKVAGLIGDSLPVFITVLVLVHGCLMLGTIAVSLLGGLLGVLHPGLTARRGRGLGAGGSLPSSSSSFTILDVNLGHGDMRCPGQCWRGLLLMLHAGLGMVELLGLLQGWWW